MSTKGSPGKKYGVSVISKTKRMLSRGKHNGPVITNFTPREGYPGSIITIIGENFSTTKDKNVVCIGGKRAIVIQASATALKVLTGFGLTGDDVSVMVNGHVCCSHGFINLTTSSKFYENGPKVAIGSNLLPRLRQVLPSTGNMKVLVVFVTPKDIIDLPQFSDILNIWKSSLNRTVSKYYDQVSYGRLNIDVEGTTDKWHVLSGSACDYVTNQRQRTTENGQTVWDWVGEAPNIKNGLLRRFWAEAAAAASDYLHAKYAGSKTLNDYDVLACVLNLRGTTVVSDTSDDLNGKRIAIRGWGDRIGYFFDYDPQNIHISVPNGIGLIAVDDLGTLGRCAHEIGHLISSLPHGMASFYEEDLYGTGMALSGDSSAAGFDLMGNHEKLPLFSAYNMESLKYYGANNVVEIPWTKADFSGTYKVMAHGLKSESGAADACHLLKIVISDSLSFYVEVRQRSRGDNYNTDQIFDRNIDINTSNDDDHFGGMVVTRVVGGNLFNNQEARFITLMHDSRVLNKDPYGNWESVYDPEHDIVIKILDCTIDHPMVMTIQVSWSAPVAARSDGKFDLVVEPGQPNYMSPDIWVDRLPYGTYDNPYDAVNRPVGIGDVPMADEVNMLCGRVHCIGSEPASNIEVIFSGMSPPSVGDDDDWLEIGNTTITRIPAGSYQDMAVSRDASPVEWTPALNQYTCIRMRAIPQAGETSVNNNTGQKNIFHIDLPSSSPPESLVFPFQVRNPLRPPTTVFLDLKVLSDGFIAQIPQSIVIMDDRKRLSFEMTLIPTLDLHEYIEKKIRCVQVMITGYVPVSYRTKMFGNTLPVSRLIPIGGILVNAYPKRKVDISLKKATMNKEGSVTVSGKLSRAMSGETVRVDVFGYGEKFWCVEIKTEKDGQFKACFDLNALKPIRMKIPYDMEIPEDGYMARAVIANSPNIAQIRSSFIKVTG